MMALWQAAAWVLTLALAVALVVGAYGGCLDPRRHSAVWSLATLAFPLVLAATTPGFPDSALYVSISPSGSTKYDHRSISYVASPGNIRTFSISDEICGA